MMKRFLIALAFLPLLASGQDLSFSQLGVALRGVSMKTANTGVLCGIFGSMVTSADGFETWTARKAGTTGNFLFVSMYDASTGWACGPTGVVYKTTNSGANWTAQTTSEPASSFNGCHAVTASLIVACGSSGKITRSTNGGTSWSSINLPTTTSLNAVWFFDQSTGIVVGATGAIRRTTDGGTTWNTITSPVTSTLSAINFIDNLNGWAVGFGGSVIHTTDGGLTWTNQTAASGTTLTINTIYPVSATTAIFGGGTTGNGVIGKTVDGGTTRADLAVTLGATGGVCPAQTFETTVSNVGSAPASDITVR